MRAPVTTRALVCSLALLCGNAFQLGTVALQRRRSSLRATAPSSWQAVEADALAELGPAEAPKLTLYRDTNYWCPFCERVELGLRLKSVPYETVLINLKSKPEWYVASTLLLPLLLHPRTAAAAGTATAPRTAAGLPRPTCAVR